MKKTIILLALPLAILFSNCGNKKKEQTESKTEAKTGSASEMKAVAPPAGYVAVDLLSKDINFTVHVPDSIKSKIKVLHASDYDMTVEISSLYGFEIVTNQIAEDEKMDDVIKERMSEQKSEIEKDTKHKLKRYIVDGSAAMIWETDGNPSEFHLFSIIANKMKYYRVEDASGIAFNAQMDVTEKQMKMMLEISRSLRPK